MEFIYRKIKGGIEVIVKISRFQPKLNKYVSKNHELESGEDALKGGNTFLGISIDARLKPEPGFMALRTQRVDRIEIDSQTETITIFTSPIVTRESKGSGRKFTEVQQEATDALYNPGLCFCLCPKYAPSENASNKAQWYFKATHCFDDVECHAIQKESK